MGNKNKEGMHWMCAWTPSLFSSIYALQGDTGWVFGSCHRFTSQGNALCHFLLLCSPLHHPQSPFLLFQVTQSLHCTQGVVITGAAEIGQDKGMFPAQDVFPPLFLFSSTSSFPSLSCFLISDILRFFLLFMFVVTFHK